MSPASTKFKTSVSLLFVLNLAVWLVAGSKLENPDWNMWIDKDDGHLSNKRITAKSVFIAPQISRCPEGHRLDQLGKCVKIATVNHANQWQFLLDKLNLQFAKKPESNAVVAGSEPFKLNIPLFNSPQEDRNKKNTTTVKPSSTTDAPTSQKIEITTRKQPHFTDLFNIQTTFTTNSKTELPSTIADTPTESSTRTEQWTSTKFMPESTTNLREKLETSMWTTEKPKKEQSDKGLTSFNKFQTNAPNLPTSFDLYNPTTDVNRQTSTVFTTQTSSLLEKLGTTLESFSTLDAAETVYPSSLPPPTLLDHTRTTYVPSTNSERFTETTEEPVRHSTTVSSNKQSSPLLSSITTTTDAPFLIIVTDTNNHIVNTNENESSVETDYILISNSSSSLLDVNKPANTVEDVSHTKKASEIKIVDKICIDSELCNDEIVLPYFESTKTIRNDSPSNSWNDSKSEEVPTSSENVKKQIGNSKIMNVLQNIKYENVGPSQQSSADIAVDSESFVQTSSLATDKLSDHSHIYESLKMPPSLPSKVDPNIKSDVKKKSDPSTVQTLVNIVQPTSAYHSSTSVYSPNKKSSPSTTLKPYIPNKKAAGPTTQKSPTLTTTKRIFTQSKPHTSDPNVYNLMYSMQPTNVDYNSNSNEFLFGSSSSYMEPQYGPYDSASYVRFPSDQQTQYKHPNSKFSLDFANTFGGDATSDAHQQASNSFIRFPTISRTPASTFNSNQQWQNTRWPPHQTVQADSTWNSRWPPHQQQPQQQYYSQNSRYQHNVPLTNYKLLQL